MPSFFDDLGRQRDIARNYQVSGLKSFDDFVIRNVEASRHLIYSAAATYDSGDREALTGRSAMAKLHATETAQQAVDVAIQVLGARGLESDSTLAHLYKEVRAPRIYEGTSEIQRNIIAREMYKGRI